MGEGMVNDQADFTAWDHVTGCSQMAADQFTRYIFFHHEAPLS